MYYMVLIGGKGEGQLGVHVEEERDRVLGGIV